MTGKKATSHPRIFYGWLVVAAAFAVTFVGFGCAYTFSAFVELLQRDFGASRGSVSLVFSLAGFLYFGLGIVSGPLADRAGSRRLAVSRHDPDRPWPCRRKRGAQPAGGLRGLWTGRRTWRRLRLRARDRSRAALVRPAPRLCVRSCRQRHRRRHAGDAAAGLTADRNAGMARRLSRARRARRRRWRRDGAFDRERSSRPRPRSRRRSTAIGCATDATRRRHRPRRRPLGPFYQPLRSLPDLFVRGLRAVRPSRTLCAGITASRRRIAVLLLGVIGIGSTAGRFFLGGLADRMGRQLSLLLMFVGHGARPGDLGDLDDHLVAGCIRLGLRRVLRRMGRGPSRPW